MDLHAILIRTPVNQLAAGVTSQRNATIGDGALTKADLIQIVARLERKQRLLKRVLGIKNKSQHRNSIWKSNKGIPQFRHEIEPRSFSEYKLIGLQIQGLIRELAEIKKTRKSAYIDRIKAATPPHQAAHDAAFFRPLTGKTP